jgi:hypothetical protein
VYEILFAAAIALGLFRWRDYRELLLTRPAIALYAFMGVVIVTGLAGFRLVDLSLTPAWAVGRNHPYYSTLLEMLYLLFDAAVMFMLWELTRDVHQRRMVLVVLAMASVVAVGYALYQLAGYYLQVALPGLPSMPERKNLFAYIIPRVTSFFKEPSYLAGFLVCLIPFTLAQFYRASAKKAIWSMVLALQCAGLYLTFSTTGWLLFFVLAGYLLWSLRRISARTSWILGGILAAIILALIIAQPQIFYDVIYDKLFGRFINPNTISRIQRTEQVWNALLLWWQHPLLGVGLGHYGWLADQMFDLRSTINLTVNNVYAELLCETGLFGLAGFVWFLLTMGQRIKTKKRHAPDRSSLLAIAGAWTSFLSLAFMLLFYPSHSLTFIWVLWGVDLGETAETC